MSLIDYELKHGKIRNKETLKHETKRTIRMLIVTLSLMIVTLSVVYLLSSNNSAQKGYTLEQLKIENKVLKSDELKLSTQVTDSMSYDKLENTGQIADMEKVETKNYVTPEDNKIGK